MNRYRIALTAWVIGLGLGTLVALQAMTGEGVSPGAGARLPTVILISMDGTTPADLTPERLPSLVDLGRRGARADALVTVDPSNTFPAHVSLATGVAPDVHRMVNNDFIDPERGRFERNRPHSWIESEPIWSIAERHAVPTASFYWVGSEGPWEGGPGPRETRKFSSRTSEDKKVDQILEWLARPDPSKRPRLITCWFHGADHAAHEDGPGAESVTRLLAPQDAAIARLIRELDAQGLFESTTLLFVSDHGMATAERRVDLSRRLAKEGLDVTVIGIGGFAMIYFDVGEKSERHLERALAVTRKAGLTAWPREAAPSDWHVDDPRFGDIVVRAPLGTAIVRASTRIEGFHGYEAHLPEMAGILVAFGRGVEPGMRLGSVSSLAIAPTVLRLLGLPVPATMRTPPIAALLTHLDASGGEHEESGETPPR